MVRPERNVERVVPGVLANELLDERVHHDSALLIIFLSVKLLKVLEVTLELLLNYLY